MQIERKYEHTFFKTDILTQALTLFAKISRQGDFPELTIMKVEFDDGSTKYDDYREFLSAFKKEYTFASIYSSFDFFEYKSKNRRTYSFNIFLTL